MNPALDLTLLGAAAFALTLALGTPVIRALRRLALRQHAYEDAPQSHAGKTGTPTMGGVLFCAALLLAAAWHPGRDALVLAFAVLACAAIGAFDDYVSIRGGRNRGLRARDKLWLTGCVAVIFLHLARPVLAGTPLFDAVAVLDGHAVGAPHWLWYALSLTAFVATAHAVNLTDGLDGLAAGAVVPALVVLAWLAARAGMSGVTAVDVALAASALAFLAFNRYPARVFMGDTGSLALGAALAGSAILAGNVVLLPLIGGVFVAETLSVIVQVLSFKATGKRVFRMSPLHHHFELGGWPEIKVTRRFWTASALLSLAGAALAR